MLLHRLDVKDPENLRARFKIVRCDRLEDVPGLILTADEQTGLCLLRIVAAGDTQEFNFGPDGLRIVAR